MNGLRAREYGVESRLDGTPSVVQSGDDLGIAGNCFVSRKSA